MPPIIEQLFGTPQRIVVSCAVLVLVIGTWRTLKNFHGLRKRKAFAESYLAKLDEFANGDSSNGEAYDWLIHRSVKMQRELGILGFGGYRPPYSSVMFQNYPLILNLIPELRRQLFTYSFSNPRHTDEIFSFLAETLLRHIGTLDDKLATSVRRLFNPLAWWREGIGTILLTPFYLLYSFGLMAISSVRRLESMTLFRLLAGLLSLVLAFGGLIGLVVDWNEFSHLVPEWLDGITLPFNTGK